MDVLKIKPDRNKSMQIFYLNISPPSHRYITAKFFA